MVKKTTKARFIEEMNSQAVPSILSVVNKFYVSYDKLEKFYQNQIYIFQEMMHKEKMKVEKRTDAERLRITTIIEAKIHLLESIVFDLRNRYISAEITFNNDNGRKAKKFLDSLPK